MNANQTAEPNAIGALPDFPVKGCDFLFIGLFADFSYRFPCTLPQSAARGEVNPFSNIDFSSAARWQGTW